MISFHMNRKLFLKRKTIFTWNISNEKKIEFHNERLKSEISEKKWIKMKKS